MYYCTLFLLKNRPYRNENLNETFINDKNNTHTLCHGLYDIYRTGFLVYKTGK